MATSQRRKGNYHENKIVEWLEEIGFTAEKQPLSGQLGGKYRGDILVNVNGSELVVEVKYRDGGSFPSAFTVLQDRDIAIYKRKKGEPKSVVIIDADIFAEHFAPIITGKKKRKTRQKVTSDWLPDAKLIESINETLKEEIDHDAETNQFLNYHIGKGSSFANIGLAYRKWCGNAIKFRKANESNRTFGGGKQPKGGGRESSFFAAVIDGVSSS